MPKIVKGGVNYSQGTPSDWIAQENSEGFIKNKPSLTQGSDYDKTGVVIGDKSTNVSSGAFSVAEGKSTTASGNYSHAEGELTIASAMRSHAEGYGTITPNLMSAHVQGRYNFVNDNFIDTIGFGNGENSRKNLSALTKEGQLILKNSVVIGANDNSTGGYLIPIPEGASFEIGKKYILTFEEDSDTGIKAITWKELEVEDDPNKYMRDPSAQGADNGPFTIYDGTDAPSNTLGKPGDIYFQHN